MIEKIIANGLSDAALAALDVAIKLGLEYGGWCQTKVAVMDRYHLEQIPGASYQTLIDKAIGAAHGSLYFVHGQRTSLSLEKNKKTALQMNKPFLLLDLAQERGFSASRRLAVWIAENQMRIMHVDGDREGQHAASMADNVASILEATFFLSMMETGITSPLASIVQKERFPQQPLPPPLSIDAAVDHLEGSLSLKDKATIANMAAEELISLHFTLGDYINTHFDLFTTNTQLLDDCSNYSGHKDLSPKDAAAVIIEQLWKRLRDTCRIRVVK
jgi:hypothetical protein